MQKFQLDNLIPRIENGPKDQDNLYTLSLIYRLKNFYHKEKDLIIQALEKYPNWNYAVERKKWHDLPEFERMVKRKPLHLTKNPEYTPKQETMEQLCIVTGCNSNYAKFVIENIESIKNTRGYKDIDIFIFDAGLTDDEKETFYGMGVKKIIDPGWPVPIEYMIFSGSKYTGMVQYKPIMAKIFMNEFFPGYRYYMWLEADAWIHDERSIDKFMCLCENQGFAAFQDMCGPYKDHFEYGLKMLTDEDLKLAGTLHVLAGAIMCVDARTKFFKEWQEVLRRSIKECGFWYGSEERTAMVVAAKNNMKGFLETPHILSFVREGLPYVLEDPDILYSARTNEPVGLVPLVLNKHLYVWPVPKRTKPFSKEEAQDHIGSWQKYMTYIYDKKVEFPEAFEPQEFISMRFRTFPWQDREFIMQDLVRKLSSLDII